MSKVLSFPASVNPELQKSGLQTLDTEARAEALDTQSSFIVEAPAGSGKTGLLVQRYLKLLLDDQLQHPEEVLAITFTNKATAELLERVLQQLHRAQTAEAYDETSDFLREFRELALAVLARDAARNWRILDNPQRLNIRSIDSVAKGIADAVPVLSGSGGRRDLLQQAQPLYAAAAHRTILQLGGSDPDLHSALRDLLLHRDASLQDTEALLASMLANREQWGTLIPLDSAALTDARLDAEVRPRLEKTLEDIVCGGLTQALRHMPDSALLELSSYATNWSRYPGYKGAINPLSICASLSGPPAAKADALDHWHALINLVLKKDGEWRLSKQSFQNNFLGVELGKGENAGLQQLVQKIESEQLRESLCAVRDLPPAKYPDEQWAVAKSLFRVLRHALAELQLLFAERGQCDFAELSLSARDALRRGLETDDTTGVADLALTAGSRLRHLLVDEMQDTSTAQYELLDLLTRSWDGHTQTLFLVGDPKQSIYAFRKAEVARFLRTMREERLADMPLQALRLSANFRSQSNLVQSFNDTFNRLFPNPEDDALRSSTSFDVPFVEAAATREPTLPEALHWHTTILEKDVEGAKAAHQTSEARRIAGLIAGWRARPLPPDRTKPWGIAVLASNRKQLAPIAAELKAAAIPYRAVEVEPLAERQEVLDALALTRALLHPADRIAWLAVLHAPWCGLGLADLLALTSEGPDADRTATVAELIPQRIDHISAEGQTLLARAWPVLATAVETLGRTSLATHIERTWRSLGGDAPLTPDATRNVLRFLTLLDEVETAGRGRVDLPMLNSHLGTLFAEPGGDDNAVELMTIHKAKGLEWDVVFVPGLERRPASNSSELLNWAEFDSESGPQVVLAPISSKGEASTALNTWLRAVKSRRDQAERKRVFYVACTRAREELHLFAAVERKQGGELAKPAPGSLLSACWPAAEPHFATTTPNLANLLELSLSHEVDEPLALAAAAEPAAQPRVPILHRLPPEFQPRARFHAGNKLPYAVATPPSQAFDRPEGSFAARAFGNVVHRYLQLLCTQIAEGHTPDATTWRPRLVASLRTEGLPPTRAEREADRALLALTNTLADTTGKWLLAAHPSGATETSLTTAARTLRADRTFLDGDTLWIIDFKTTEQGSRTDEAFEAAELSKYREQLEAYGALLRRQPITPPKLMLGLFYPLKPRLLQWESAPHATP